MTNTQTVIRVDENKDLYSLIAAMGDVSAEGQNSVVLWSETIGSPILKSVDELDLVQIYAKKFSLDITLSAANDPGLTQLAKQAGWKVLWEMPEMDAILHGQEIEHEANQWVERALKTDWQRAG